MKKYKVLNLYAGIGGNRKLWTDCEVTAVEINPEIAAIYQDFFPNDKVIIADAHEYLLNHFKEYDFIWLSPTCQENTRMILSGRNRKSTYPNLSIYQYYIFLNQFFKGKFVIENVKPYFKPLIEPSAELGRHLFWSNFNIPKIESKNLPNFINEQDPGKLKKFLGLEYKGNIYYNGNHDPCQVLRNCVIPEIGLHIFNHARNIQAEQNIEQGKLNF